MTFAEAQRAIYIDFEQPKGRSSNPPRPALLGILVGAEGEDFEQLVIDERLRPACVANRRCRVASLQAAASEVLARAATENRNIAAWSIFDQNRLIEALPERADEIQRRYVNALHIGRRWRRIIYPAVAIQRDDPHSARHTLDKYAKLAGYDRAAAFERATPAKWIKATIDRLNKSNGSYRALSKAGKRDWHRLLEYNRHDCLALRHVVLKATREMECWRAYERTRFCVDDSGREICFLAGSNSRKADALLRRHRATRWAFITAWNPASVPLGRAENERRQQRLRLELAKGGYRFLPGEGRGDDPSWEPEDSLLVLRISEGKAVALGRQFGQLAVVVGRRGESARLVSSAPKPAGLRTQSEPRLPRRAS